MNNTLSSSSLPPAELKIETLSTGTRIVRQILGFDYFNYAGILRSVHILYLPAVYISNLKIEAESCGFLKYQVWVGGEFDKSLYRVDIAVLEDGKKLHAGSGLQNSFTLDNYQMWWPKGLGPPNLYTFEVRIVKRIDGRTVDSYRETFGFRSVEIHNGAIYINGKFFYCHGFGRHEDYEVYGRGFSRVMMIKDLNLLEWSMANCFRTSHYPYSEEEMYEADRRGIIVIDEVQATGLKLCQKIIN